MTDHDHALSVDTCSIPISAQAVEAPALMFTCTCGWEQVAFGPCSFAEATTEHDRVRRQAPLRPRNPLIPDNAKR